MLVSSCRVIAIGVDIIIVIVIIVIVVVVVANLCCPLAAIKSWQHKIT